jgi:hypothetical protein
VIGLVAALDITRLMSSLLVGVSATNLPTFRSVGVLFLGVAVVGILPYFPTAPNR